MPSCLTAREVALGCKLVEVKKKGAQHLSALLVILRFRLRLAFRHRVRILAEEIERRRFFRRELGFHLLRLLTGDFRQ